MGVHAAKRPRNGYPHVRRSRDLYAMSTNAAHEPTDVTRGKVQALSQFGIPQDLIAESIGISAPTLRKHYRAEINAGKLTTARAVANNLYQYASGAKGTGSQQVTAGMFWARTQMGWKETVDVNHTVDTDGAAARLAESVRRMLASRASAGPIAAFAGAAEQRPN